MQWRRPCSRRRPNHAAGGRPGPGIRDWENASPRQPARNSRSAAPRPRPGGRCERVESSARRRRARYPSPVASARWRCGRRSTGLPKSPRDRCAAACARRGSPPDKPRTRRDDHRPPSPRARSIGPARAGCLKVSTAVAPMRLAAILLLILLPMLLPILLPILLLILLPSLVPRLSLLVAAMLLPLLSPRLWSRLSPLVAPELSSLLASMLSRRLSSLPASRLSSMLSSLPASRLSSKLSWSLAPMRRRPQNRKSRRRGL